MPTERYRLRLRGGQRWLPYETTQSHIPGGRDKAVDGLWVKILGGADLAPGGWVLTGGAGGDEPGRLLVGSPEPLDRLYVDFGPLPLDPQGGNGGVRIEGAEAERTVLTADGGIGFLLRLDGPRAVHPMWWTADDWYLYRLVLDPPPAVIGVPFTLRRGGSTDLRPSTDVR